MFDFVERAIEGMDRSRDTMQKNQEVRFYMWLTEMCLKYNKAPEEIIELTNKCYKHMKKTKRKPGSSNDN